MTEKSLTIADMRHLLSLLRAEQDSGEYAGNRQQYYDRAARLIARFQRELDERTT